MTKSFSKKPLALALGAAFTLAGFAAQASVFQTADLAAGYMVASAGDEKMGEHKAGEAKCGADCLKKMKDDGKSEADAKAMCDKAKAEGKCGGDKKMDKKKEGKCGEGKCGGKK
jgi:uncharacterized low-complexity protein